MGELREERAGREQRENDADQDGDAELDRVQHERARQEQSSGGSAFLIAGLVASWFVYSGSSETDQASTCDGGLCAVSLVFGVFQERSRSSSRCR